MSRRSARRSCTLCMSGAGGQCFEHRLRFWKTPSRWSKTCTLESIIVRTQTAQVRRGASAGSATHGHCAVSLPVPRQMCTREHVVQ